MDKTIRKLIPTEFKDIYKCIELDFAEGEYAPMMSWLNRSKRVCKKVIFSKVVRLMLLILFVQMDVPTVISSCHSMKS